MLNLGLVKNSVRKLNVSAWGRKAVRGGRSVNVTRKPRSLYKLAWPSRWHYSQASNTRKVTHVDRLLRVPQYRSCVWLSLHALVYNMTVTSKMNSVSRQSVLSRLGPGGLLYAANKILAVRHRIVWCSFNFNFICQWILSIVIMRVEILCFNLCFPLSLGCCWQRWGSLAY